MAGGEAGVAALLPAVDRHAVLPCARHRGGGCRPDKWESDTREPRLRRERGEDQPVEPAEQGTALGGDALDVSPCLRLARPGGWRVTFAGWSPPPQLPDKTRHGMRDDFQPIHPPGRRSCQPPRIGGLAFQISPVRVGSAEVSGVTFRGRGRPQAAEPYPPSLCIDSEFCLCIAVIAHKDHSGGPARRCRGWSRPFVRRTACVRP